ALVLAANAPGFDFFLLAYSFGFGSASGAIYILVLESAGYTTKPKRFTAIMVASFGFGGVVFGPILRMLVAADWGLTALLVPAVSMALAAAFAFTQLQKSIPVMLEAQQHRDPTSLASSKLIVLLWMTMAFGSAAGLMTLGFATTVVESQGGSAWLSSLALSGIALGNTCGRLTIGALPRRFPVGWLVQIAACGSVFGLLLCVLSSSPGATVVGMMIVATSYGIFASGIPVLTRIIFGAVRFGRVYSIVFTAWGMAGLASPWVAGILFDASGNFTGAFMLATGISAASLVFAILVGWQSGTFHADHSEA
ncbi:MAG: hypothetical protein JKY94_08830, partial [Rhodobacteraceae bacterium]|nr:hypothetical protein [Paracoccaceae bacterium]